MDPSAEQADNRRPLASRKVRFFQRLAVDLGERGVTPNAVSLSSIAFALLAGLGLWATSALSGWPQRLCWVLAAAFVQLRLLANMIDGLIAVESGKGSPTGELYNEVPDRISDPIILIGAGYAAGSSPTLGYLAGAMALLVAYVRAEGVVAGARQHFEGPMAKPQRMFFVTVVCLYAGLAPAAWQPVHAASGWGVAAFVLILIIAGCVVTIARRLRRIAAEINEPTT